MQQTDAKIFRRLIDVQCGSPGLFAQFMSFGIQNNRYMAIAWWLEREQILEPALAMGGSEQIGAAHNMCESGTCVVHGSGQLIGIESVPPFDNKVFGDLPRRARLVTQEAILEPGEALVIDFDANAVRCVTRNRLPSTALAACAPRRQRRSSAYTSKQPAGLGKPVQR